MYLLIRAGLRSSSSTACLPSATSVSTFSRAFLSAAGLSDHFGTFRSDEKTVVPYLFSRSRSTVASGLASTNAWR